MYGKTQASLLARAIKAQMTTPEAMNPTLSALEGMRAVGMAQADALAIVQGLAAVDFFKSMRANADHRVWQDVYPRMAGNRAVYQVSAGWRLFCDFIQGAMR